MKLLFLVLFLWAYAANAMQVLQPVDTHIVVKQQDNIPPTTAKQSPKQLLVDLKKSAKSGDVRAQYSLANMYRKGINVPQNDKLAFYWYLQVAGQGYANAQLDVANHYYDGVGVTKNTERAGYWYQKSAEQGNIDARYYWALILLTGESDNKNTDAALSILLELSTKGHTLSQYQLSQIYQQGEIVEPDDKLYEVYLYQASKGGHVLSQYQLGKLYQQKQLLADAIYWLDLAAKQNHQDAEKLLSEINETIKKSTKNHSKTSKPITKFVAADARIKPKVIAKTQPKTQPKTQQKPKHQKIIASINPPISTNVVSGKTPTISVLPAASVPSKFEIARSLLENNKSIPDIKALVLSAKQGDSIAQYNLGVLFDKGEIVAKDDNKAFRLIQASAKQGLARSQNALAIMYINGVGVEENAQSANFWARASARQNNQQGIQILLYLLGVAQLPSVY